MSLQRLRSSHFQHPYYWAKDSSYELMVLTMQFYSPALHHDESLNNATMQQFFFAQKIEGNQTFSRMQFGHTDWIDADLLRVESSEVLFELSREPVPVEIMPLVFAWEIHFDGVFSKEFLRDEKPIMRHADRQYIDPAFDESSDSIV